MTYSQELLARYLESHTLEQLAMRQLEILEKGKPRSATLTVGELALLTDDQKELFWSWHQLPPTPPRQHYDIHYIDHDFEPRRSTPARGYWQSDRDRLMDSTVEDENGL